MAGYREFQTGEVLTAANVNGFLMNQAVMVFADDAARDTALAGVITEGMLTYNLDTKALEVYDGTDWGPVVTAKEKRIEAFTGSGTWTVPAGVNYAIAHMLGGGGGLGQGSTAGNGGASSVAFASGTVTAPGMPKTMRNNTPGIAAAAPANSAASATGFAGVTADGTLSATAQYLVAGASVTPAASISVTVGAGGTAGTGGAAGGSGYVYIEYYEEV